MSPADLIQKHAHGKLCLDTNILLLLIAGRVEKSRIPTLRCTQQFEPADYDDLEALCSFFSELIATPHILAEVSNLLGNSFRRNEWESVFSSLRLYIGNAREHYDPALLLAANDRFSRFGLTDSGIINLPLPILILTDDFPLSNVLSHLDRDVINFNHIRNWM